MKQKKTFKSLSELSVDSIGAEEAQPEKAKPQEPQAFVKATPKIAPASSPRSHDVHGYHHWGLNE